MLNGDKAIRVGLIDDDPPFRRSVRMLLEGTPGFACCGSWGSLEAALHGQSDGEPDVILLDVRLPGTQGSQGVAEIRRRFPTALVLMLTGSSDDDVVFDSLCRGASGYLLKGTPPARLLEAIEEAYSGGSPMSPVIARKVVTLLSERRPVAEEIDRPLSERELEVLERLAAGRTYQEAASELSVSINTLRNHVRSIYDKLQVHSCGEAVSKAMRGGLI